MKITLNKIHELDYRWGHGRTVEIFNIVVKTERGRGYGTTMLEKLIKISRGRGMKRIYAFTRKENEPAHRFYEKNGFIGTDLINFYPDGDAKIFIKEI